MDSLEEVKRQGYWFRPGLLDGAKVAELGEQVIAICERHGWLTGRRGFAWNTPEFAQLQTEVQSHPLFTEIRENPLLVQAAGSVLGGLARAYRGDICRVTLPDAPEFTTPPHQDQFYLQSAGEFWGAWIPLSDCPTERGGLAVVPASRQWGLLPHGEGGCVLPSDGVAWTEFDFRAGDVLLVQSLTVHRSLDNCSRDLRISIDCRFAL